MRSHKAAAHECELLSAQIVRAKAKKDGAFTPVNRAATHNENIHRRSLPVAGVTMLHFGLLRRLDVSQSGVQRVQNHPQHDGPRVAAMQIPANLIQINTVTPGRRSLLHM